ncbi:MAG: hypothetical protein AABY26_00510, partial [Nanoarchaeota archaeon]
RMAFGLSEAQINKMLTIRAIGLQEHQRVAAQVQAIPETTDSYQGQINITRGYRPANIADMRIEVDGKGRAQIELNFDSYCGDETRPIKWMQYDALLAKAKEAGFDSNRGSLDQEVEAFKADDSTYFKTGPIDEVMSAFEWSELEAAVDFLWKGDLPEDMKRKLGK